MKVNGILLFVLLLSILYVVLSVNSVEGFQQWSGRRNARPLIVNEPCEGMCERRCLTQPECDDITTRCTYDYNSTSNLCQCNISYIQMVAPDLYHTDDSGNTLISTPYKHDYMDLAICDKNTCDDVFAGLPVHTAHQIKENIHTFRTK